MSTLDVEARTEAGPRPENQDAVLSTRLPGDRLLVAIADGMGGLRAGAEASRRTLTRIESAVRAGGGLADAILDAHRAVQELAETDAAGSTVVAALIGPEHIEVAHVGDSRAYRFGGMGLEPLTRDHTVSADAEERGELAAREVAESRWGKTLSRALGTDGAVEVDRVDLPGLESGGWLVLTSDGVHGPVPPEEMERIIGSAEGAAAAADGLMRAALAHGTRDNLSALVVHRPRGGPAVEASVEPTKSVKGGTTSNPGPAPATGAAARAPAAAQGTGGRATARASWDPANKPWDPRSLIARSSNRSPRRSWVQPMVLGWLGVVAVVLGLMYVFLT